MHSRRHVGETAQQRDRWIAAHPLGWCHPDPGIRSRAAAVTARRYASRHVPTLGCAHGASAVVHGAEKLDRPAVPPPRGEVTTNARNIPVDTQQGNFFHVYTVGYLELVAMEVSKVVPITLEVERVHLRFQ